MTGPGYGIMSRFGRLFLSLSLSLSLCLSFSRARRGPTPWAPNGRGGTPFTKADGHASLFHLICGSQWSVRPAVEPCRPRHCLAGQMAASACPRFAAGSTGVAIGRHLAPPPLGGGLPAGGAGAGRGRRRGGGGAGGAPPPAF